MRDIDGILLLENASLHAVIADAVARAGDHGVVDGRDGQSPDGVAVLLDEVHLRNLFVERATGERDAEHRCFESSVLFLEARRAAILGLVMALDAVVRLIERGGQIHAHVGEVEALAMAPVALRQRPLRLSVHLQRLDRNQVVHIQLVRNPEQYVAAMFVPARWRECSPARILRGGLKLRRVLQLGFEPARNMVDETRLGQRLAEPRFQFSGQSRSVEGSGFFLSQTTDGFLLDELTLQGVEWREGVMASLQRADFGGNAEQFTDEVLKGRRDGDHQLRLLFARERAGIRARFHQVLQQRGIGRPQGAAKSRVQTHQTIPSVQVLEGESERQMELVVVRVH